MSELLDLKDLNGGMPAQWQTSLVIDVAMGVSKESICEAYGLQYPQLLKILEMPSFAGRLEKMEKDLAKEGASFRLKAQMQAEDYLKTSYSMVKNDDVDPRVRADLIKSTARWAGFDAPNQAGGEGAGAGISISINLGAADKQVSGAVIENGD